MKHLSLLAFSLLLWGCHSSTEQKNLKSYTAEQLYNNKSIGGARFNGDESRVLVNANNTGIFNIYSIAVADTVMKPLTNSTKDSYFAVGYVAGSDNFLYVADQGGNENYHIYLQKQNAVTAKDITPWDGRKNSVVGWSDEALFAASCILGRGACDKPCINCVARLTLLVSLYGPTANVSDQC